MILVLPMRQLRPYMPLLLDEYKHSVNDIIDWTFLKNGDIIPGEQGRPKFLEKTGNIGRRRWDFVAFLICQEGYNISTRRK